MSSIGTLTIEMAANIARLQADMDQAKRVVNDSMKSIEDVVGYAKKAFVAFIGIASVDAFVSMIKGAVEAKGAMHDLSISTGMSVAALGAFKGVGAFTETSLDSITGASLKLSKNLATTSEESKGAGAAIKALGLDLTALKAMTPEQQMLAVAQAMGEFENGSNKSAAAMMLFGKEGAKLLPFLSDLADDAEKVNAKLTEQGIAAQQAKAAMADAYGDNLMKLEKQSKSWRGELADGLLPVMWEVSESLVQASNKTGGFKDMIKDFANSGELAEWARGAVLALTYLVDVGQGLLSLFPMLGKVIGGVAAGVGVMFGSIFDAFNKLQSGDMSGAWDSLKSGLAGVKTVGVSAAEDISAIWNQKLIGQTFRESMESVREVGIQTGEAKKQMGDLSGATDEAAQSTKKQADAYRDLLISIQQKIAADKLELAGGRNLTDAQKFQQEIQKLLEKGKITLAQATSDQVKAMLSEVDALQREKTAAEESAKIADEVYKQRVKDAEALEKQVQDIEQKTEQQLQENAAIGKTKSEIEALELARLREQAALLQAVVDQEAYLDVCTRETQAHQDQLAALQNLIEAKEQGVQLQMAKEAADEWKKTAETIDKSLTDALMRGFEAGKGFMRNLADTTVNLFKTLVLRPVIAAVVNPVASTIAGALGVTGAANAAGGSSTGSLAGNALTLGGASLTEIGSSIGAGFSATLTGQSVAGAAEAYSAAGMSGVSAGLQLGAAAPYIAAALAVYSIAQSMEGGETRSGGKYGWGQTSIENQAGNYAGVTLVGGPSGGQIQGDVVQTAITSTISSINSLLKMAGSSASLIGFQAGLESSSEGKGGVLAGGLLSTGVAFGESGTGSNYAGTQYDAAFGFNMDSKQALEAFATNMTQATLEALQAADIGGAVGKQLSVDIKSLSKDEATALLASVSAHIEAIAKIRESFAPLGGIFSRIASASSDAQVALTDMAGGIGNLISLANSFIKNYYTPDEQMGLTAKTLVGTLEDAGIDVSTLPTKGDYRKLVESLNPEDGTQQKQLVTLLQMGDQFALVADYLESNNMTMQQLVDSAPQVALLNQMIDPSQQTAAAANNIAAGVTTTNGLLTDVNDKLDSIQASAQAAAAAAGAAAGAAAAAATAASSAASAASSATSAPTYTYNLGGD